MAFSLKGVHVPHRKNTADKPALRMEPPKNVTLPMSMHIGAPAKPIVKVGDEVKVGTLIAEAGGALSAPIHASVSGKVTKITDFLLSDGRTVPAVILESDGAMTPDDLTPPVVDSRESLIEAIRNAGIVGLGGAGFPTHFKLNVDPSRIEYLIINGAECEPYVTSDTRAMLERGADIGTALDAIKTYLGIKKIVFGIESNKKSAIDTMKILMKQISDKRCDASVKVLPPIYPQGGEKVLIYHTCGRTVPTGKLPIDVGCVVINCTTLAAIGSYLKTGMPLVEKCVTVDGGSVTEPKNVIAPVGTPVSELFAFCGGFKKDPAKVVYGGPMMGITVPDVSAPVLKNTNAVLALTPKDIRLPKFTACIRCGSCTNTCPFGINPANVERAYHKRNVAALDDLGVTSCMECGCCSFMCPANRPLVQTNRLAKNLLREEKEKEDTKA